MDDATVISSYRNLGCGDGFRVYLKINQDELVEDASFTTTGCGFGFVSLAMACEWAKNKSVDQLEKITATDVESLFEFPPKRKNYPDSAVEAMHKAVNDYRNNTGLALEDRVTKKSALALLEKQGHLRKAKLNQVILEGEDLSNVDLSGADLSHAFLQDVNFENANLSGCKFRGAFLNNANLKGANFEKSDLRWCKLAGANTDGASFKDAIYDIGTRLDPRQTHLFESMIKADKTDVYREKKSKANVS